MPDHRSLVALAKHHAAMKATMSSSHRRRRRQDVTAGGGAGQGPTSREASSSRGPVRRETTEGGDVLEGVKHTRGRESGPIGGAMNGQQQQQQRQRTGGDKCALNMHHRDGREGANLQQQQVGEGGRGRRVAFGHHPGGSEETAARRRDVVSPCKAVGESMGVSPSTRQGGRLSSDPLSVKGSDHCTSRRKGEGVGEIRANASGGRSTGSSLSEEAGVEEVPPTPRGVKLAVVAGEAGVQLFDVGLHDAEEVAETAGVS